MAYNICEGLSIPATNFIDSSVVVPKFSNVTPIAYQSMKFNTVWCVILFVLVMLHVRKRWSVGLRTRALLLDSESIGISQLL